MRELTGAILVLAGSVLVAAEIIADAITRDQIVHGNTGYILGGIIVGVGVAFLFGDLLRRAWDAIPVDDKRPNPPK